VEPDPLAEVGLVVVQLRGWVLGMVPAGVGKVLDMVPAGVGKVLGMVLAGVGMGEDLARVLQPGLGLAEEVLA